MSIEIKEIEDLNITTHLINFLCSDFYLQPNGFLSLTIEFNIFVKYVKFFLKNILINLYNGHIKSLN